MVRDHRAAPRLVAGCGGPRGFTLLELLTTLGVVSILLSVGVPTFFDVMRNSRAATNANQLVTSLSIARSEAIRRGARVSVCRSADGETCGGTWEQGWIVFTDGATTDDADPPVVDEVLSVGAALSDNTSLTPSADMGWVRFLPRGNARTPAAAVMPVEFNLEFDTCSGLQARNVELNAVGRTSVERVSC